MMYLCKSFPFLSGSLLCLPSLSSLSSVLPFSLPPFLFSFPFYLPSFLSSPPFSLSPPSPLPFSSLHSSRNAYKSSEQFYKLNYHHPYLGFSHRLLRQPRTVQCQLPRLQGGQPGILVAKGGSCDVACDHTLLYVCNLRKVNSHYCVYMCVWGCVEGMCGVDGRVCELMLEIARVVLKFITMEILFSRRLQNVYYNYPTHTLPFSNCQGSQLLS